MTEFDRRDGKSLTSFTFFSLFQEANGIVPYKTAVQDKGSTEMFSISCLFTFFYPQSML